MLMVVLRFVHVVSGAVWVGAMAFMTFFLMPAFAEVGPEAGKFMAALQKRRVPVVLPIIALLTIVSGLWLFQRLSGGQPGALMATPMGMAFGLGGLAAIIAFLIGIIVGRAAMMRNMKLAESLPKAAPDQRAAVMAEMKRLQARGAVVQQVVMALMLFALGAMAVARYL